MDYRSIGLDDNLMPLNSPISQNRSINPLDYDGQLERNSIMTSKVRTLNFSKGFGGTLELGGNGNGIGVLEVQGSAGNEVVRLDNEGMTVYNDSGSAIVTAGTSGIVITDGNLTVQNSAGTTILDGTGLVSANNFRSTSTQIFGATNTSGTTYTNYTNGTLDPIVLTRNTVLGMYLAVDGFNLGFIDDNYSGAVRIFDQEGNFEVTGSEIFFYGIYSVNSSVTTIQAARQRVTTMLYTSAAAGTHTYKIQFKAVGGGTASINYVSFGVTQFGS